MRAHPHRLIPRNCRFIEQTTKDPISTPLFTAPLHQVQDIPRLLARMQAQQGRPEAAAFRQLHSSIGQLLSVRQLMATLAPGTAAALARGGGGTGEEIALFDDDEEEEMEFVGLGVEDPQQQDCWGHQPQWRQQRGAKARGAVSSTVWDGLAVSRKILSSITSELHACELGWLALGWTRVDGTSGWIGSGQVTCRAIHSKPSCALPPPCIPPPHSHPHPCPLPLTQQTTLNHTGQGLLCDVIDLDQGMALGDEAGALVHGGVCHQLDGLRDGYDALPDLLTQVVEQELARIPAGVARRYTQQLWSITYIPQVRLGGVAKGDLGLWGDWMRQ